MKLAKVLTVAQVAALAGWRRKRMLRHLFRLNEECGGMILRNVGRPGGRPQWTVTIEALQRVAPQWFTDDDGSAVQARLDHLERVQERLLRVVGLQAQRIKELESAAE